MNQNPVPPPTAFADFSEFSRYLDSLGIFHMDLGLHRARAALDRLDLGQGPYLSIQVLGTNGKGSTSVFLAEMLRASGLKTGLFTSPHFVSPLERIQVDSRPLEPRDWLRAARAVLGDEQNPDLRLTYFELLTVMAAWLFRDMGCQATVFEAGLGGAHDATSALAHDLTLFTPISLDHQAILGPHLADIARDKAQAMRPGVAALSAAQPGDAAGELQKVAKSLGAPLHWLVDTDLPPTWPVKPGLAGAHQVDNLRLALGGLNLLAQKHGLKPDSAALRQAAARAFIPGRLQFVPGQGTRPDLILDGAHNQAGLASLAQALNDLALTPGAMIFACLADKDWSNMVPLAQGLTRGPILVPGLDVPGRSLDPKLLAQALGPRAKPVDSLARALAGLGQLSGPVLICGSLYLLAEFYELEPSWLNPGQ